MSQSTPSKIDKQTLALSLALESIMQITLRQEAANNNLKYIANQEANYYLTVSNLSEIICTKLVEGREFGGAVNYLSGCFKRLAAKESTSDDKLKTDLQM